MLHIVFVCTGNICRSPMAEVIIRDKLTAAGITEEKVLVTSCGIGGWHVGQGADRRAVKELAAGGYDGRSHRATELSPSDRDADLLLALDTGHITALLDYGVEEDKIRLFRSFDPSSPPNASVADPYYGGADGFTTVRHQIEACAPGIVTWVREHL